MMNAAIAAAQAEARVGDDLVGPDDREWTVTGFVAWDPTKQEWTVSGLKVIATGYLDKQGDFAQDAGGQLPTRKLVIEAEENLISSAQREVPRIGICVACPDSARGWSAGMWRQADGADWLCSDCRSVANARAA